MRLKIMDPTDDSILHEANYEMEEIPELVGLVQAFGVEAPDGRELHKTLAQVEATPSGKLIFVIYVVTADELLADEPEDDEPEGDGPDDTPA